MDSGYLKRNWQQLTAGLPSADEYYAELLTRYNEEGRHYHTLSHIETLLRFTDEYADMITDAETLQFAIWYHDAIYDPEQTDNELKSAELAKAHLTAMNTGEQLIADCYEMIIATKTHKAPEDQNIPDLAFMLDIDLSILGAPQEEYRRYTQQIRQEYAMYPDELYNYGRAQILDHFLEKEHLYCLPHFRELWEENARDNLGWELAILDED